MMNDEEKRRNQEIEAANQPWLKETIAKSGKNYASVGYPDSDHEGFQCLNCGTIHIVNRGAPPPFHCDCRLLEGLRRIGLRDGKIYKTPGAAAGDDKK
jgi:hypothetical protein